MNQTAEDAKIRLILRSFADAHAAQIGLEPNADRTIGQNFTLILQAKAEYVCTYRYENGRAPWSLM